MSEYELEPFRSLLKIENAMKVQDNYRIRVKICCIGSIEEARLAMEYGASALGLGDRRTAPAGLGSSRISCENLRSEFKQILVRGYE